MIKRKKLKLLCMGLLCSIVLTACGASSSMNSSYDTIAPSYDADFGYSNGMKGEYMEEAIVESGSSSDMITNDTLNNSNDQSQDVTTNRKLIKTVSMDVETDNYDKYIVGLNDKILELGGYIESSTSNGNSIASSYRDGRYANYKIRVPQDKLNEFVDYVGDGANILTKRENVKDITLEYVDQEARKGSLLAEEQRLIELLNKAENLTDVIEIEDKLSEIRYEIDSIESALRTYDNLVSYSVVNLTIEEVERYTEIHTIQETPFERMTNGFIESINNIKDGFVDFCVNFVIAIPYLLIYAIIILLFVLLVKLIIKKIKRKIKNVNLNTLTNTTQDKANVKSNNNNINGQN